MHEAGDTQAIPCVVDAEGSAPSSDEQASHDSMFEAALARIDAIAREWAGVLDELGAVVGPAAEQLVPPTRIQGPMATAPIQLAHPWVR
jgi:hypothetical protein